MLTGITCTLRDATCVRVIGRIVVRHGNLRQGARPKAVKTCAKRRTATNKTGRCASRTGRYKHPTSTRVSPRASIRYGSGFAEYGLDVRWGDLTGWLFEL